MRRFGIAIFLFLYAFIVTVTHFYITLCLVVAPGLGAPWGQLLSWTIGILGLILWIRPFAELVLPRSLARLLNWPASVWMGFSFLALMLFIASDLALWLADLAAGLAVGRSEPLVSPAAQAIVVAAAAIAAGFAALRSGLGKPRVRRIEVELERWPTGLDAFRIVQISDIHIGPLRGRRFAGWLVRRCNELGPDVVAVTGDLVDGSVQKLAGDVAPFAELRARHGVFFVTGNHDYFSKADPWISEVQGLGFRVLRNDRVTIGNGTGSFDLAGVDDHFAKMFGNGHGEDVAKALADRDPERPVILLAHNPATFDRAAEHDVDLQLSGHTHGGQIWPFRYAVRLSTPYVAGEYRRNGSRLYVSRGTGFWGPPMRLFAPAEITEVIVRSRPRPEQENRR